MPLVEVAQLESGHTPSRRHPEYWNGDIPWVSLSDATANHGRVIYHTDENTNQLGIDHSSARILPPWTVCLSRTASVGFVVAMGRSMATSQDFVNWICSPELDWRFLKYVLQAESDSLIRFAHGTTHQTIYFPEVKALHICLPPIDEQKAISSTLGSLDDKIEQNLMESLELDKLSATLFTKARDGSTRKTEVRVRDVGDVNAKTLSPRTCPAAIQYLDISSVGPRVIREVQHLAYVDAPSRARRVIREGDTILSTVRPERRAMLFVPTAVDALIASTGFAVVSPREISPTYLYREITSDRCIDHLAAVASGSAYPAVDPEVVADWAFAVPEDYGDAFERVAGPVERLRWHLMQQNRLLASLRDGLLPRLVSGQVRLGTSRNVANDINLATRIVQDA